MLLGADFVMAWDAVLTDSAIIMWSHTRWSMWTCMSMLAHLCGSRNLRHLVNIML